MSRNKHFTGRQALTDGATALSGGLPDHKVDQKQRNVDTRTVHGLQWALLPYALNKYGYPIEGSGPTWKKVQPRHREMYRHIGFRSKFLGYAWEKYHTMAGEFDVSDSTIERWMRELHHMGLVLMENRFVKREDTGAIEYTSNAYWPQNPLAPGGDVLAVVHRGNLRVLTQLPIEIPPLPNQEIVKKVVTASGGGRPQAAVEDRIAALDARIAKLEDRKRAIKEGKPPESQPAEVKRTPLVVLSTYYRQMAERMGVYDLLEQSAVWAEFEKAKRSGQIRKKDGGAGAYFWGILQKRKMQKAIDMATNGDPAAAAVPAGTKGSVLPSVQSTLNLPVLSPAHALTLRDEFLRGETMRLLAEGHGPVETAHRLIRHPGLVRYDRYLAEPIDVEWLANMIEAQLPRVDELKTQLAQLASNKAESDKSTSPALDESIEEWLVRRRDEIRARGSVAPALSIIADELAYAPDRPGPLRKASPAQVLDLLHKLR